ncbi:4399_t:CDS:2 [Dentiscutata heterogama]|uniref:4399_t:CDS:1 n=1 Tax=Dentiscutata heterogama TaxID=1316150 RepID=A0ACA9PTI3_9GLOM|nr:4399_t:CDS:2 [Dentiscutata heterogama]
MSSLFIAFCLVKNVTGNNSYITRIAIYRINDNTDKFREITFKGFSKNSDSLVTPFEKNSIVLIVSHYVCEDNVTIIQSVLISYSDNEYTLTQENLLNLSLLLLYLAPVVPNSYIPDNNRGQLKLGSKKLPHILASDIEWIYPTSNPQTSNTSSNRTITSQGELDTQLESIKEKYAALISQFSQKRQRINL